MDNEEHLGGRAGKVRKIFCLGRGAGGTREKQEGCCQESQIDFHELYLPGVNAASSNLRYARAALPWKRAAEPSSSSMRRSWLYFAMRSVRLAEPVLIWPAAVATARSAMYVSSVSPERWEMMEL